MRQLDKPTIEALRKAGLLKSKFADYMTIGKIYRQELAKTGSKMQAYTNASMICHKTERSVVRAVKAVKSLEVD
jgi:hypothetical protein